MKTITTLFLIMLLSVTATAQDVYVAGTDQTSMSTSKLWKNGFLEYTLGSYPSLASSVFVSNGNVYTGGNVSFPGEESRATLWVNSTPQYYTNGDYSASINDVFVSGNDVYAIGYHRTGNNNNAVATLWVNGIEQALTNGNTNASALSVFVSGGDVYVAGYENNGAKDVAKLWKNGAEQILTDGSDNAKATSVLVDGGNIYITGYEETTPGNNYAILWKNGVAQYLTDGLTYATALDVDLYVGFPLVVGGKHDGTNVVPTYWLDGSEYQVSNISNWGQIFSVYIASPAYDNKIYMAGYESNGTSNVGKLWSSSSPGWQTQILTTNGQASSVFVDDATLGVEAPKALSNYFAVYPNPVQSQLNIKTSKPRVLQLYNLQGQLLNTIEVTNQHKTIDMTNLSSGLYLLKDIDTGDTQKIIKE